MSDEFEAALDEQLDLAAEGLRGPDETDLAQDREDRQAGESQKETVAEKEEPVEEDRFEYELPDGTKFEGTFDEIVAKVAEATAQPGEDLQAKIHELEAKLEAATVKPAEEKPKEEAGVALQPVDWTQTGDMLATRLGINPEDMSDGERRMLSEVGPMMDDAIHRTVLTSPYIAQTMETFINKVLDKALTSRETKTQTESAFDQFVGDKFTDAEIATFQKTNPWADNRQMAILGLKQERQAKGVTEKGKSTEKAIKEAEAKTRKEVVRDLKAKGTLRKVSGGQPGNTNLNRGGTSAPRTESERLNEWTKALSEKAAVR